MRRCVRPLCACLLALITVVPVERPRARLRSPPIAPSRRRAGRAASPGGRSTPTRPAVERRVIVLVNRFRRRHGLHRLKLDPGLRYAARARGMIDKGLTARLALYSPSVHRGERGAQGGRSRAAASCAAGERARLAACAAAAVDQAHRGGRPRWHLQGRARHACDGSFSAAHPPAGPRPAPVKPKPALRPASPPVPPASAPAPAPPRRAGRLSGCRTPATALSTACVWSAPAPLRARSSTSRPGAPARSASTSASPAMVATASRCRGARTTSRSARAGSSATG